jgi:hypothetical protein
MIGPDWLYHPLGVCALAPHAQYVACRSYNFWSGSGSDISEITLLGIAIAGWKHVNCAAPWCFRIGRHPTADGLHKLCRRHHPDLPNRRLSLQEIHDRHRAHQQPRDSNETG